MNESSWDDNRSMPTGGNMAGRQSNISKDDAGVSYFFQRPQETADSGNYSNKRWAVGDDSVLEQVSTMSMLGCHFVLGAENAIILIPGAQEIL